MNITIPSERLNRYYCIASGNEYIGVPARPSYSPMETEKDFFNMYDGCAFE